MQGQNALLITRLRFSWIDINRPSSPDKSEQFMHSSSEFLYPTISFQLRGAAGLHLVQIWWTHLVHSAYRFIESRCHRISSLISSSSIWSQSDGRTWFIAHTVSSNLVVTFVVEQWYMSLPSLERSNPPGYARCPYIVLRYEVQRGQACVQTIIKIKILHLPLRHSLEA